MSSSANTKALLREQVRARLKTISSEQRSIASAQIRAWLAAEKSFTDAKVILFFAPLPNEPDIWPLLTAALLAGKTVALPGFEATTQSYTAVRVADLARDLVVGQFGIREPAAHCPAVPLNQLDFVLVPGVAFASDGHRLGRGKGYYDRLLHSVRGATCGVAFDEQIVGELPVEPHDIRLSYILTPTRWQIASPARF